MTALIVVLGLASIGIAIVGWSDFYGNRRGRGFLCVGIAVLIGVACFFL